MTGRFGPPPTTLEEALVQIAARDAYIEELEAKVSTLEARMAALEERLNQSSKNSSKPPSSDGPDRPSLPKRPPSGRKPGGQRGHKGHHRELLPPDQVSHFEHVWPDRCGNPDCRAELPGALRTEVGDPIRHQVTEIPPIVAEVTEWQLHCQQCPCCDYATQAELPGCVPTTCVGPRLQGIVAVLGGLYKLSKRATQDLLLNLCNARLSLGSVTACERRTSDILAAPVAEAHEYVQDQPVLNADETGWREARKRAWLWVAVTGLVTVFMIHGRRSGPAARKLLGRFSGILGTDRWCAYSGHLLRKRQICWAHLKRHWLFFVERGGKAKPIGEALQAETDKMFEMWHRVRDGTLARSTFQAKMSPVRARIEALLAEALTCGHAKVASMCNEILAMSPAMWTFVRVEGVEPTNNGPERALRPAVQYRKTSYGTHSGDGSRFLERVMTVAATLKQQDRNVFDYVTEACERSLNGLRPRSILPHGHVMSPKALTAARRALATA